MKNKRILFSLDEVFALVRACECTRPDDEEGLDDYKLEHRD